jgi:CDP-6-deoxy-D-xylo-4-hexulose-3-dehydrase
MKDLIGCLVQDASSDPNRYCIVIGLKDKSRVEAIPVAPVEPGGQRIECSFVCSDGKTSFLYDPRQIIDLDPQSVLITDLCITQGDLDTILRSVVLSGVERYYREIHKASVEREFQHGERIPYAGRVFDYSEMKLLTEASLDFWLTSGRFSKQFERDFANKLGVRFACLTNSGSSANLLALTALTSPLLNEKRIRPGDEVITVAAGFPTTINPIIQNGCVPVFVDIAVDDGTYNIDVSQLEEAFSHRTRALMLAHTLGNPFDLARVTEFCEKNGIYLIEDNCDALGSSYRGQLTGTFGDLATSSFYPPHHMTMGEGGAVYSKNLKFKRIIESVRDWGRDCWCPSGRDNTCGIRFQQRLGTLPIGYDHKYIYRHFGYNLKVTDMQAAIGCAQLDKVDQFCGARRQNWNFLRDALSDLEDTFVLPSPTPDSDPSWFGFILTLREKAKFSRNEMVQYLESNGIQTRMLFAGNILRHPLFDDRRGAGIGYRAIGDLRNSDRVLNSSFWLGVYPGLKTTMLEYVVDKIRMYVGKSATAC